MTEIKRYIYFYEYSKGHLFSGSEEEFLAIEDFHHKEWHQNGKLHRTDGPAKVCSDGSQYWYQNGKRHRIDGPAVIWSDGFRAWYQNGKLHRTDGPAQIWPDGCEEWRQNGKRHRIDGPAVNHTPDGLGVKQYWINGRKVSFLEMSFKWLFANKQYRSPTNSKQLDILEDKIKQLESRIEDLENRQNEGKDYLEKHKEKDEDNSYKSTTVLTLLALAIKMFIGPFKIGNRQF